MEIKSHEARYSHSPHYTIRKLRHREVDAENEALLQRLAATKPKMPDRRALRYDFLQSRQYQQIAQREPRDTNSNNSRSARPGTWGSERLKQPQREPPAPGPVFCPELQRRLNPGAIPSGDPACVHKPQGTQGVEPSNQYLFPPKEPKLSQGRLPPEPAGMEERERSFTVRPAQRLKLHKYSAWPEERPPVLHRHPGLALSNDML
jgi:hypothetical protein